MKNFVIIASQRSGSYMLSSALDSLHRVKCYGELFRAHDIGNKGELDVLAHLPEEYLDGEYRREKYKEFLRLVFQHSVNNDFVGFKFMIGQAENAQNYFLNNSRYKKVVLYRENILAVYSSKLIAELSGVGFLEKGKTMEPVKVSFEEEDFLSFMKKYEKRYQSVINLLSSKKTDSYLLVTYDALLNGSDFSRVKDFLGVDSGDSLLDSVGTAKRNPRSIVERFYEPGRVLNFLKEINESGWACE
jgi:hypothetical protein